MFIIFGTYTLGHLEPEDNSWPKKQTYTKTEAYKRYSRVF